MSQFDILPVCCGGGLPCRVDSVASTAAEFPSAASSSSVEPPCCSCLQCGEPCVPVRSPSPGVVGCCSCAPGVCVPANSPPIKSLPSSHSSPSSAAVDSLFQHIIEDEALFERFVDESVGVAITRGITMQKYPPPAADTAGASASARPTIVQVPLTLLPSRIRQPLYEHVLSLVPHLNLLYERISRDRPFLHQMLQGTAEKDEFVARLLNLLTRIDERHKQTGAYPAQSISLALNRSDYMLHDESCEDQIEGCERCVVVNSPTDGAAASCVMMKQVEFNTISCGANSLSNRVSDLHRSLLTRFDEGHNKKYRFADNQPIAHIVAAMAHAHRLFIEQQKISSDSPPPVVLFVVQAREGNLPDQKALELALWEQHAIIVRRMTLPQVEAQTHIDERTGQLFISATKHQADAKLVSLVYFRAGYTPRDFASHTVSTTAAAATSTSVVVTQEEAEEGVLEWSAMERLHRSVAIKCPSLALHLAGAKKIQQVLTLPGNLERFISDEAVCRSIRSVFVRLYPLTSESVAQALERPHRFVLKPQREGGGNNLWGDAMVNELTGKSIDELQHFILMDVIGGGASGATVAQDVPMLKNGEVVWVKTALNELGMVGALICEEQQQQQLQSVNNSSSDTAAATPQRNHTSSPEGSAPAPSLLIIHRNEYAGYLLRTKSAELNEGGLMSGAGAIDSLVLV